MEICCPGKELQWSNWTKSPLTIRHRLLKSIIRPKNVYMTFTSIHSHEHACTCSNITALYPRNLPQESATDRPSLNRNRTSAMATPLIGGQRLSISTPNWSWSRAELNLNHPQAFSPRKKKLLFAGTRWVFTPNATWSYFLCVHPPIFSFFAHLRLLYRIPGPVGQLSAHQQRYMSAKITMTAHTHGS